MALAYLIICSRISDSAVPFKLLVLLSKVFVRSQHCSFLWPLLLQLWHDLLNFPAFLPLELILGGTYFFLRKHSIYLWPLFTLWQHLPWNLTFPFHYCAQKAYVHSFYHLTILNLHWSAPSVTGKPSRLPGHPQSFWFLCFSVPALFPTCTFLEPPLWLLSTVLSWWFNIPESSSLDSQSLQLLQINQSLFFDVSSLISDADSMSDLAKIHVEKSTSYAQLIQGTFHYMPWRDIQHICLCLFPHKGTP